MGADHQAGERFQSRLADAGLDRAEFARLSGFSRSAVNAWCQGWRSPPGYALSWLSLYKAYRRYKRAAARISPDTRS